MDLLAIIAARIFVTLRTAYVFRGRKNRLKVFSSPTTLYILRFRLHT